MNLRTILMKYAGWCPGLSAAARFVPDKKIPKGWMAISVAVPILILFSVGYYVTIISRPTGPLIVKVDGAVYSDDVFTADFNYSLLVGKKITFYERPNRSELYDEQLSFEVESLDEVWPLLDRLKIPNVTRGLAKILLNGTYDDVVTFFRMDRNFGVQILMGDIPSGHFLPTGVSYRMERLPTTPQMTQEITIYKEYARGPDMSIFWRLWIKVYEYPPFEVSFSRSQDTPTT